LLIPVGQDSVFDIATHFSAGRSRDRIPVAVRFSTLPDQLWGPPSLLYNGYQVSFPSIKWPECGIDHPPPSGAKLKKE
jgi:hypothetical protein